MASLIFAVSVRESCVGLNENDGELVKEGALESDGARLMLGDSDTDGLLLG
jgi:hypothetical protein